MSTAVILRILVFYVLSLFLVVAVIPWNTIHGGESPYTLALDAMHVPWTGNIMSVIILTAVLSCLNSAFYVGSRVLFSLAEHGDAPQFLVMLNARKVPVASVTIGAIAGYLGIIAATEAPQQVFDFLVSSSGAVMVFVYGAVALAQIVLRRRRERQGAPRPPVTMWLFPYLSFATIAGMGGVLLAMAFTPGLSRDLKFTCISMAFTVAAYGIVRWVRARRAAVVSSPVT
jgi:AAT family amino acid transporter/GABA permease